MKQHLPSGSWRRYGVLAMTGLLATSLVLATPGAATAKPSETEQSARWLESQLTNGLVHNDQFDFDDYGLSADFGLGLAQIDGHRPTVRKIARKLAKHVDSYTTGADFMSSDIYAGSTAKAAVLAQTADMNAKDFGGVNLIKRLKQRVSNTGPTKGRIQDASLTDYANVIGQAYAAQALDAGHSDKADEALKFLLKQQCDKGWFRLNFTVDKEAADQTCDGGDRKTTSAPDTDATAIALLSLLSLDKVTPKTGRAIQDAVNWLVAKQKKNGSFGGGPSTEAPNTNSSGLAASALGAFGACRAAHKAARWIAKLQVSGNVSGTQFKGEKGAIAYDKVAYAEAKADGIDVEERDQWRRATAQAAPALVYLIVDGCD